MIHHVNGCLGDASLDFIILHYGTNDLNGSSTSEEIADKVLNLAASVKTSKNQDFVSGLVIRNDRLNKKGNEINELLRNKCGNRQLSFIDNKNISLDMLNKSGIHLNENGTTGQSRKRRIRKRSENKIRNKIRNKTEKEESAIAKRVNKNLVFNVNSSNTDRPVNPTVDNNKSLKFLTFKKSFAKLKFPHPCSKKYHHLLVWFLFDIKNKGILKLQNLLS